MGDNGNGKTWYEGEKIFFQCQKCGKCCEKRGILMFTENDINAAADYLEMKEDVFRKTYLKYGKGYYCIVNKKKQPCPFLTREKECRIQEAKPQQCKNYPFWPQILEDKKAWEIEKTYCIGIGKGEEIDKNLIFADEGLLKRMPEEYFAEIMAIRSCGENYKVDGDGRCRSGKCDFGGREDLKKKIVEEGCLFYYLYLKMEKGE